MEKIFKIKLVHDLVFETIIEVDTNKFTRKFAQELLVFFTWDYDEDNDPVIESVKKHCIEAFRVATTNNYNVYGVKSDFENKEGFVSLDGKYGLTLLKAEGFDFDDDAFEFELINQ